VDGHLLECPNKLIQGYESSGWERMTLSCWSAGLAAAEAEAGQRVEKS